MITDTQRIYAASNPAMVPMTFNLVKWEGLSVHHITMEVYPANSKHSAAGTGRAIEHTYAIDGTTTLIAKTNISSPIEDLRTWYRHALDRGFVPMELDHFTAITNHNITLFTY